MSLDDLRSEIDDLDKQLVALLNKRASLALEVGQLKHRDRSEIYVPSREKEVFDHLKSINQGPLKDESLVAIYREIMSASISLEADVRIAYLGPDATFSHQAARSRFGASVKYLPLDTIEGVFTEVEAGRAEYGVVPIENSIRGPVGETLDCLADTTLHICSEMLLDINQCVMASCSLDEVQTLYGHPQSLGQCRNWIRAHLPSADLVSVTSTSKAAEKAASDPTGAAIASELAAELHTIPLVEKGIQDRSNNRTRFLVIGRQSAQPSGNDKTSIIFSVKHSAGSLYSALESFRDHALNMTKIESRPSGSVDWQYWFYVDVEGHQDDANVAGALSDMADHCTRLHVLGSYPRAAE
jgi:chorismate mutase/prephenate dehydratase